MDGYSAWWAALMVSDKLERIYVVEDVFVVQ